MPAYEPHPDIPLFPHPLLADESGLLAIGGKLSVDWLYTAYAFGIFPWFGEWEPILWWFPRPRAILRPDALRVSKSLRSTLRKGKFRVTFDNDFTRVIRSCAEVPRPGQDGTWIVPEMENAYIDFHRAGYAHSVEVWDEDQQLVGGLYGILMGRIFFGESMFSVESDASKVALVHLVERLNQLGVKLIDCQQDTPHMRKMGAVAMPAEKFYLEVAMNLKNVLLNVNIGKGILSGFQNA